MSDEKKLSERVRNTTFEEMLLDDYWADLPDHIAALEQRLAEAEADTQHPESVCDDCGEKNVVWSAPSELWN